MKYLSVCSGIEAATVAWHPLGWSPFAFSEIEAFPSSVLQHHYPTTPNFGDMTLFKDWSDATFNVLVGGTPCQSFSLAGLRKGLADPRGNLALTYLAIADRYRPRWLVWENVPGVLSSWSDDADRPPRTSAGREGQLVDQRNDFDTFLAGIAQLGYGFAYRFLDAQFCGVPQRRRRVFVVACLGSWQCAAAVLSERFGLSGHPPPSRTTGQGATHDLAPSLVSSGRGVERAGDTRGQDPVVAVMAHGQGGAETLENQSTTLTCNHEAPIIAGITGALTSGSGNAYPGQTVQDAMSGLLIPQRAVDDATAFDARQSHVILYGNKTGPLDTDGHTMGILLPAQLDQAVVFDSNQITSAANGTRAAPGLPASTLAQGSRMHVALPVAFTAKDSGGDASDDLAPTLRSMNHAESHANGGGQIAVAFESRIARNGRGAPSEVVPPLKAQSGESGKGDTAPLVMVPVAFKASHYTRGKDGAPSDVAPPLSADADKGDQDTLIGAVGFQSSQSGVREVDTHATLDANNGSRRHNGIITGMEVRRLTPLECERLQGFPDGYTAIPTGKRNAFAEEAEMRAYYLRTGQAVTDEEVRTMAADGPRYKALGNSMAVPVMRWLGQRIATVDAIINERGLLP